MFIWLTNVHHKNEIRDYINTRIYACGYHARELFSHAAIKSISKYSKGLLRKINILADKALIVIYAYSANTVTAKHVKTSARKTNFVEVTTATGLFLKWVCIIALAMFLLVPTFNAITEKYPDST